MRSTVLLLLEKPCFWPAGTTIGWPAVCVTRASPIHTSACPLNTRWISSTACRCVGAPWPDSNHCSNTQSTIRSEIDFERHVLNVSHCVQLQVKACRNLKWIWND